MASVFALLEAFKRKEAAALGFFPCATASYFIYMAIWQIQEFIDLCMMGLYYRIKDYECGRDI